MAAYENRTRYILENQSLCVTSFNPIAKRERIITVYSGTLKNLLLARLRCVIRYRYPENIDISRLQRSLKIKRNSKSI